MTNFPPGIVNGTIHVNDTTAQAGEAALTIAYNNAAGRVGAFTPAVGNVGGLTFTPGLYSSGTSTAISGGGDLTLMPKAIQMRCLFSRSLPPSPLHPASGLR